MNKQVNFVYPAHQGDKGKHYEGPEGIVWISNCRDSSMPNVLANCYCGPPQPGDSLIMMEPIVTQPQDYNMNFLNKFKYIFGCFHKVFEGTSIYDKYIHINYGSELGWRDPDVLRSKWLPWDRRINGVTVIAGAKDSDHPASIYKLRVMLAEFFYQNGLEVAFFGGMKQQRPYYKGQIPDKNTEILKYRFHICSENTYDQKYSYNYMTEKLPHSFHNGAIPLYMGCYNIEDIVPENTFIDLRKYVTINNGDIKINNELISVVKNFTEQDFNNYQQAAYDYMKKPDGLFYHTDMYRYYKKILEIL